MVTAGAKKRVWDGPVAFGRVSRRLGIVPVASEQSGPTAHGNLGGRLAPRLRAA